MATHYLACDLGAESGRLIAGTLDEGRLELRELHRFPNVPLKEGNSLHWNIPNLVLELKEGLRKAAATALDFESISTDSWGVDYLLFDSDGEFMPPAFHYRDSRTQAGVEHALGKLGWPAIFEETGIQFMPLNTIFQLAAENPDRLRNASFLLGVGDAFNYFLSGVAKIEVSMASTFQLYNPRARTWSSKLIEALEFPASLFPPMVASGTRLGHLRSELAKETGLNRLQVIATCSHDTGAAVAGVPASGKGWGFLSSGTWSLMGVELDHPVISDAARELNFTNEIGYGNTVRLLKNISGLWLVQECRREWERQGRVYDYATLTQRAAEARPFRSLINPSAPEFLSPKSMPAQMAEFCQRTGQPEPETEGESVRCALESLALLYRRTLAQIERLTGQAVETLHIVGGGSQNDLLNQFAANAVQKKVLAGPAEATAAGNILIQAIALGHIGSLEEARKVVQRSSALREFTPRDANDWNTAFERFEQILKAAN